MVKKLLIQLVKKAYQMGREDERKGCDADINVFEKLVAELLE